ncbi:uncharacterized protein LOC110253601 [Exaiptasia diaphana]|uniref:Uncharacterized protein n=1 Tax=Exaiptasia diaphana TaxID=2652724 RepID=A0A913Y761_EXADI|nr:uncharacterized protein LOC110253601 [Exaiptasia diaphana]
MGHGAGKHSKNYLIEESKEFSNIVKTNEEENSTEESLHHDDVDILVQIHHARTWPDEFKDQPIQLKRSLKDLLETAAQEMTTLSKGMKYNHVEEIAKALVHLTTLWDKGLLSSLNIKSFNREIITLEIKGIEYMVQAGEFFKSEPFYGEDERLVKLYFFHVKELSTKCRIMSYYLECSYILQPYFMLGLHVSGTHLSVQSYDRTCPSYWVVRDAVIRDMKARINANMLVKKETRQQPTEDLREGVEV